MAATTRRSSMRPRPSVRSVRSAATRPLYVRKAARSVTAASTASASAEALAMTRVSEDELCEGHVFNGFDYNVQVWIVDGVIRRCGHPASMRLRGVPCCNAYRYAG